MRLSREDGVLLPQAAHQPSVRLPLLGKAVGRSGECGEALDPVEVFNGDRDAAKRWRVGVPGQTFIGCSGCLESPFGVEQLIGVIARIRSLMGPNRGLSKFDRG
jgi:hypothetical protein